MAATICRFICFSLFCCSFILLDKFRPRFFFASKSVRLWLVFHRLSDISFICSIRLFNTLIECLFIVIFAASDTSMIFFCCFFFYSIFFYPSFSSLRSINISISIECKYWRRCKPKKQRHQNYSWFVYFETQVAAVRSAIGCQPLSICRQQWTLRA